MCQYKVLKTTMGRKYKVRMCEDEVAERDLFRLSIVLLPLISSVLMFLIWVKAV